MSKRFLLGILCILTALVFMVYSLLEPKTKLTIKPSAMPTISELAYYSFRQLTPFLSDQIVFLIVVDDAQEKEAFISSFKKYGIENDRREFEQVDFQDTDTLALAIRSYKERVKDLKAGEDKLSLIVSMTNQDYFANKDQILPLYKNLHVFYYYQYTSLDLPACPEWKRAFLLQSPNDFLCFAQKHKKRILKVKKPGNIFALEQVKPKHYIIYSYPR